MDADLFKKMQEAALRFRAGESDYEELVTPNGLARIVRDASDPRGFTIEFADGGEKRSVPLQDYPASSGRPPGYPAPLPFLSERPSKVDTVQQSITWRDLEDPDAALEDVSLQCEEDGWTPTDAPDAAVHPGQRAFEKDGVVRTLHLTPEYGEPRLVMRERRVGTTGSS